MTGKDLSSGQLMTANLHLVCIISVQSSKKCLIRPIILLYMLCKAKPLLTIFLVRAICPARHGTSQDKYHCDTSNFKLSGNRPKILYRPDGTHAIFTNGGSSGFGSHSLAFWDWMPQLARDLLHWADYGSAQVPILGMEYLFRHSLSK